MCHFRNTRCWTKSRHLINLSTQVYLLLLQPTNNSQVNLQRCSNTTFNFLAYSTLCRQLIMSCQTKHNPVILNCNSLHSPAPHVGGTFPERERNHSSCHPRSPAGYQSDCWHPVPSQQRAAACFPAPTFRKLMQPRSKR